MGRDPSFSKNIQFDYVQDATPTDPKDGESWWDTGTDELKVYNGSAAAFEKTGVVDHAKLTNVSASQHHPKTSSLDELTDSDVTEFTADTSANRPAAGTADRVYFETDTGRCLWDSGTSWVQVGVTDHVNLTGVGSSDHHTRYADSEARTAVDGANVNIAGDADTVDGKHASELGNHIEAKETSGSNYKASVSWTTSFGSSPVVVPGDLDGNLNYTSVVTSRSTTGATVDAGELVVKMIMAMDNT